jgi:hypothetical protein
MLYQIISTIGFLAIATILWIGLYQIRKAKKHAKMAESN